MAIKKKEVDAAMVLHKIQNFCSYQERCIRDIERKLRDWTVQKKLIPVIIDQLQKDGYLNEARFALAFASGKFRINKWGRQKIEFEMRLRGLTEPMIRIGLKEIDEEEYRRVLHSTIIKKLKELIADNDPNIREKLISSVHGKGFEMDLIIAAADELKL